MAQSMKIVMLGAGGWGALVGAYLTRAGADVTLLFRRQAHVDAIRKSGLVVEGEENFTIAVNATANPAEVAEPDLLIVAVKNQDTDAALDSVSHLKQIGAVLSVQNGLGQEEKLSRRFPRQQVLGMVSRIAGSLLDYGRVRRGDRDFPTWVGDPHRGITPLVSEITELFNKSGLPCFSTEDIRGVEWTKVLWWVPSSLTAVLTRLAQTQLMQIPELAYLVVMMTREGVTVAERMGIQLRDYPTIEIMDRCRGAVEEGVASVMAQGKAWEEHGGKGYKQAMLLDVERGRKTEVEETAGYLVRRAEEFGLTVPFLETGYHVVRGLEQAIA
ncbi:MAG: 2-dehydropantoate 2-reductase [Chloroflexi bacterium]|nr:2-dehydropantoate 2-reductase [Chloroflexota bacterium]